MSDRLGFWHHLASRSRHRFPLPLLWFNPHRLSTKILRATARLTPKNGLSLLQSPLRLLAAFLEAWCKNIKLESEELRDAKYEIGKNERVERTWDTHDMFKHVLCRISVFPHNNEKSRNMKCHKIKLPAILSQWALWSEQPNQTIVCSKALLYLFIRSRLHTNLAFSFSVSTSLALQA